MLSRKDIIELNKRFHRGTIVNGSSLDHALETQARSRNWLRTAAVFTRSIMVDHTFADGNKRTAAGAVIMIMRMNKIQFDPEMIPEIIVTIAKKNISNVRQIERYIKNVVK